MVAVTALWLPILVAAVLVFVASSLIHMVLKYHSGDLAQLPGEERIAAAFRESDVPPGDYYIPHTGEGGDWNSPDYVEKLKRGPVAVIMVRPSRPPRMGLTLVQWFLYLVLVGVFVAYITGRAVPAGGEYLDVFRFAGTTGFVAFGMSRIGDTIWYGKKWSTVFKDTMDALIYALLMAGVFGWLWPG